MKKITRFFNRLIARPDDRIRELDAHAEQLVRAAYQTLLKREPDPEGFSHWISFLRNRGSYQNLLESFVKSPEYLRLQSGPPPPKEYPPPLVLLDEPGVVTTDLRFAVLGNCQNEPMARCLQALVGGPLPIHRWVSNESLAAMMAGTEDLEPLFASHDKVFLQPWIWMPLAERYAHQQHKVVLYPMIGFMGYQPDAVPVLIRETGAAFDKGPCLIGNSSIALLGWKAGLSAAETVELFNIDTYRRLGFFDYWDLSVAVLIEEGKRTSIPLDTLVAKWSRKGCFMYDHVHPKLYVIADIAKLLLGSLGIPTIAGDPTQFAYDYLSDGLVWPVYPEIAEALGCEGNYLFKLFMPTQRPDRRVNVLGLTEMVERSFAAFESQSKESLVCSRFDFDSYRDLLTELQMRGHKVFKELEAIAEPESVAAHVAIGAHPYRDLPAENFWRKAVAEVVANELDPVVMPRFTVDSSTKVAAAGSCFAQHIARRLDSGGFNFLRTEAASSASQDNDAGYSARYGNVYTARQLRQLIQRAYGDFQPQERFWIMPSGRYIDPFRPTIQCDGFGSIEELDAARDQHLAAVRRLFETLDVFVFTLGLTEAWKSKADGAIFPLAPGVVAGSMDSSRYEFVNFNEAEVAADMAAFVERLTLVNPRARLIFTVSPVPLAATYSGQHVLVANAYSKAVLRVAAERTVKRYECCDYFPSYEIITGNFNRGRYYDDDLRTVTSSGVEHVMKVFFHHYASLQPQPELSPQMLEEAEQTMNIVCDENLLASAAAI